MFDGRYFGLKETRVINPNTLKNRSSYGEIVKSILIMRIGKSFRNWNEHWLVFLLKEHRICLRVYNLIKGRLCTILKLSIEIIVICPDLKSAVILKDSYICSGYTTAMMLKFIRTPWGKKLDWSCNTSFNHWV